MAMELRAIDFHSLSVRLNAFDWPGTGTKPQVFDQVAQLFVALGCQFGHRHAFLHVRVVAFQLLELQAMAGQRCDQLAKPRVLAVQSVIAGVHLLALGVIDAQVKRVAVSVFHSRVQVLERLQPLKTRQAAHHRQDA